MRRILLITGNEAIHNYFISLFIENLFLFSFDILKYYSGISDYEFYKKAYKVNENPTEEQEQYIVNYINSRASLAKEFYNRCFKEQRIFKYSSELNRHLSLLLRKQHYSYVFCMGAPIINDNLLCQEDIQAYNFHNGKSKYYRGAGGNLVALANNEFHKVGYTVHKLERKVDSGDILVDVSLQDVINNNTPILDSNMLTFKMLNNTVYQVLNKINNDQFEHLHSVDFSKSKYISKDMVNISLLMKAEKNLEVYLSSYQ